MQQLKKRKGKSRERQSEYTFYLGYFIGNGHDLIQIKSS